MLQLIHAISSFFKRGLLRISTVDVSSFCIDNQNTVLRKKGPFWCQVFGLALNKDDKVTL